MRIIKVNGVKCEVSKSEAEFVRRIPIFANDQRQRVVFEWLAASPSLEAKDRRQRVVNTLYPPVAV